MISMWHKKKMRERERGYLLDTYHYMVFKIWIYIIQLIYWYGAAEICAYPFLVLSFYQGP